MNRAKEKEPSDLESLTHIFKSLSNEMTKLKQRKIETTMSNKPSRFNLFIRTTTSSNSNNQLLKSAQSSNVVWDIENLGLE